MLTKYESHIYFILKQKCIFLANFVFSPINYKFNWILNPKIIKNNNWRLNEIFKIALEN